VIPAFKTKLVCMPIEKNQQGSTPKRVVTIHSLGDKIVADIDFTCSFQTVSDVLQSNMYCFYNYESI
jgi:hypothetical protein